MTKPADHSKNPENHSFILSLWAVGFGFVFGTIFVALLEWGYVWGIPAGLPGLAGWMLPVAMFSQAGLFNLLPAAILTGAVVAGVRGQSLRWLGGLLFGLPGIVVLTDVLIYRLFRHHIDAFVWNLIITPESRKYLWQETMLSGKMTMVTVGTLFALCLIFFIWLGTWVTPRLARLVFLRRMVVFFFVALCLCAAVERVTYALIRLSNPSLAEVLQEVLPHYWPLRVRTLARKLGYVPPLVLRVAVVPDTSGCLDLPKQPLVSRDPLHCPNILIVAVEGGRPDALNEVIMPKVHALATNALWLQNHFSTGNNTGHGIFGLLYGIPPTYATRVMAQFKDPPWFDLLAARHYQWRIFSSDTLNFPMLRQTAFVQLTNYITDQWDCPHLERDRRMTDRFVEYLQTRKEQAGDARPFFGFLFYDATHQPYEYPPECAILPTEDNSGKINYARLAAFPSASRGIKNRYLNAMHYVDSQIGRVIRRLGETGEYERTVIIIIGDHGEEFDECGHFGHASDFNKYQTRTFAVLRFPGGPPQAVTNMTSHLDFVPSVLTWMGITNALADYTTGRPIQTIGMDGDHSPILISGWRGFALVKPGSVTVFGTKGPTRYQDDCDHPLSPGDPRCPSPVEMVNALEQTRQFLK
jgi:hypothetical protein